MPFGDEGAVVSNGDLPPHHQDAPPDVVASARARARALAEALDLQRYDKELKEFVPDPIQTEKAYRQMLEEILDEEFHVQARRIEFRHQRRGEREDIDIHITHTITNPDAAKAFQAQRAGERADMSITHTITSPDAAKAFQAQRAGERAPVGPAAPPNAPPDEDVSEPGPVGEGEI
jgi:hypothetical protein